MAILNKNRKLMITKVHTVAFYVFTLYLVLITVDKMCSKSFVVYWRCSELMSGLLCVTLDNSCEIKYSSKGDEFVLAWLSKVH